MKIKNLIVTSFVALMIIAPAAQAAHAVAPAAPTVKVVVADRTAGDCYDLYGDIVDTVGEAGQVLQNWQNAATFAEKKFWMRKYENLHDKYVRLVLAYKHDCLGTYEGLPTDVPAFPTQPAGGLG